VYLSALPLAPVGGVHKILVTLILLPLFPPFSFPFPPPLFSASVEEQTVRNSLSLGFVAVEGRRRK
jgi:hypothetical protein